MTEQKIIQCYFHDRRSVFMPHLISIYAMGKPMNVDTV